MHHSGLFHHFFSSSNFNLHQFESIWDITAATVRINLLDTGIQHVNRYIDMETGSCTGNFSLSEAEAKAVPKKSHGKSHIKEESEASGVTPLDQKGPKKDLFDGTFVPLRHAPLRDFLLDCCVWMTRSHKKLERPRLCPKRTQGGM